MISIRILHSVFLICILIFGLQCVSASKYEMLEKEYADSQTSLAEAEQKTSKQAEDISTLQEDLKKSVSSAAAAQKRLQSLEVELAKLKKELAARKSKQKSLESQNQALIQKAEKDLAAREKALTAEIADLKKQIAASGDAGPNTTGTTKRISTKDLVVSLGKELATEGVTIERVENQVTLSINEKVFFDSGSALLKIESREILRRIAAVLKRFPERKIYIEGHTDDREIGKKIRARYPTNWELAAARAVMVVRYLVEDSGLSEQRFAAMSFARNRPVASNDSAEGRSKNRRIEIVIVEADRRN